MGTSHEGASPPPIIRVNGRRFRYLSTRAYDPTSVYKGKGCYLRLGPQELISKEVALQEDLLRWGFPVARVIDVGESGGLRYFVEESVGGAPLIASFSKDFKGEGRVSSHNFSKYLRLTRKFLVAQLSTSSEPHASSFESGIAVKETLEDLHGDQDGLVRALRKVKGRLAVFPVVLCHGDLNPSNFVGRGIIDFEWSFWGYAGYDAVTSLYFTYFFPRTRMDSGERLYEPAESQTDAYLGMVDRIYRDHRLPEPSGYLDDFLLAKAVWAAAKLGSAPNLQKWRFALLKEMIAAYAASQSITKVLTSFPS